MAHLYAVALGGDNTEFRLGEDHEVVFVVAEDPGEARINAKAKWSGANKTGVHVDSLARIEMVDGCQIQLIQVGEGDRIAIDRKYAR